DRADLRALARGRAALRLDADAHARRLLGEFALDAFGSRESPFGAPALLDRPGERSLDRRCRRVDVVTIEAKPRLQAQRIARTQSDQLHARLREKTAWRTHARV